MKFYTFCLLILASGLTYTIAQPGGMRRCPAEPQPATCTGVLDEGSADGEVCELRHGERWHYDAEAQECVSFHYRGCAGNSNRHCVLELCERLCMPRA